MSDSDDSPPPGKAWLAAIVAVALVAIAVWEIVAIRRARATPDTDWAAASKVVRERYAIGDMIVFAPEWADPIGRLHLGDLIPLETATRMDAARYARIWELSIRGARAKATAGRSPAETIEVGGVTVRRFEQTPVKVVADVRNLLASAIVDGPTRPTLEVAAEVGFEPHRCLQIVPPAGKSVRITFPNLPAGTLVGYAGLADVFTRRDIRRPGRLVVEAGGAALVEVVPGVDDGWVRFETPVPGGDVTFVASADAAQRQICFAAEVRK